MKKGVHSARQLNSHSVNPYFNTPVCNLVTNGESVEVISVAHSPQTPGYSGATTWGVPVLKP